MFPSSSKVPLNEATSSTSTNPTSNSQSSSVQALPDSPSGFKWLPLTSYNPTGGQPRRESQPHPQSQKSSIPFASTSRSFVPGGSTASTSQGITMSNASEGGKGESDPASQDSRTDSSEGDEQEEEEETDTIMTVPTSTTTQAQAQSVQVQQGMVPPPRRPPIARSNVKGQIDPSQLRLGGGGNSPRPPNIYRSSPVPTLHTASSTSQSARSNPSMNSQQPRPSSASTSTNSQSTHSNSMLHQSSTRGGQDHSNVNNKKRAHSNDSQLQHRNSPAPPNPQPRAGSLGTKANSVNSQVGGGGVPPNQAGSKRTKFSSAVNRCVTDGRAIHGAVGDILHVLQNMETEIAILTQQLEDKSREILEVSKDRDQFKKEIMESTRQAIKKMESANQALSSSYNEARNAMRSQENEAAPSIDELRRDLEDLKRAGSQGSLQLEKNEETKLQVLRELQNELADRAGVIKLLRSELESRTGELSEARDSISTITVERQNAYQRIETLSADLDSFRRSADEEKNRLRDQLDKALLDAGDREQALRKQTEETVEKWSNVMLDLKKESEEEIKSLKMESQKKEDENNGARNLKITEVQQDYQEKARQLSNAHAEERLKLELNLKITREEVVTLKNKLSSVEQNLQITQNSNKALMNSAELDKEALRSGRAESEQLRLKLSEKNADIDNYEAQLVELQNRLSEAENSAAVTYHLEIERLEGEKAEALSGKTLVDEQLTTLVVERDSLSSTVALLETSLSSAHSTTESLATKVSNLEDQLAASELERSTQATTIAQLEENLKEVEELRKLKERFEEEKQKFADEEKEKLRLALIDQHSVDKMDLQNANKKLKNQLNTAQNRLTKVQAELAEYKGQNKMGIVPTSSSNESADSNSAGAERDGGRAKSTEEEHASRSNEAKLESPEPKDEARLSLSEIEQTAAFSDESDPIRSSSPLSSPGRTPAVAEQAGAVEARSKDTTTARQDANSTVRDLALRPTLPSRKRTIDNPDNEESNGQQPLDTSLKRQRRTLSNENKGPNRQDDEGGNKKPKTRVVAQQNEYSATTKKKR